MEYKREKLIRFLKDQHPAYGTQYGLSTYTGGMADTGYWLVDKLLDSPIHVLQVCTDDIKKKNAEFEKRKNEPPEDMGKVIHHKNGWIHEKELEALNKMRNDFEKNVAFPDSLKKYPTTKEESFKKPKE